jgi:hypothetical protein
MGKNDKLIKAHLNSFLHESIQKTFCQRWNILYISLLFIYIVYCVMDQYEIVLPLLTSRIPVWFHWNYKGNVNIGYTRHRTKTNKTKNTTQTTKRWATHTFQYYNRSVDTENARWWDERKKCLNHPERAIFIAKVRLEEVKILYILKMHIGFKYQIHYEATDKRDNFMRISTYIILSDSLW